MQPLLASSLPSPRGTRHSTRPQEVASRVSERGAEASAEARRSGCGRRRGTEPSVI